MIEHAVQQRPSRRYRVSSKSRNQSLLSLIEEKKTSM